MLSIIKEFIDFMFNRKKYWLFPLMFVLLLLGGLVIVGETSSVGPFIYEIF